MIKSRIEDGVVAIESSGTGLQLLEELIGAIKAVKDALSNEYTDEFVEMAIVYAGQMAFAETNDEMRAATDMYIEWLEATNGGTVKEQVK